MQLVDITYRAGSQTWLHAMNLSLSPGINVLLGATLSGKTTTLRVMAGLEQPTTGRIRFGDRDVTGVPVRRRNLAMVYQQFINYPSMTVYDNIASPLRLAGRSAAAIRERVHLIAETLQLTPFLDRRPAQHSGGQQQRTALARALAKDAELVLLDEPLVNLDYKLREDLRRQLQQLFAQRRSIAVYATTEPQEALQLGGHTAVLAEGRLVQHGPTLEVFRRPATLQAARAFSDPPLNEIPAELDAASATAILQDNVRLPLPEHARAHLGHADRLILAVRAHQLRLGVAGAHGTITGEVELAEINGSETYVHVRSAGLALVAQLPGVHELALGDRCTLHLEASDLYGFSTDGQLMFAPE